jgi:hypothetical protein
VKPQKWSIRTKTIYVGRDSDKTITIDQVQLTETPALIPKVNESLFRKEHMSNTPHKKSWSLKKDKFEIYREFRKLPEVNYSIESFEKLLEFFSNNIEISSQDNTEEVHYIDGNKVRCANTYEKLIDCECRSCLEWKKPYHEDPVPIEEMRFKKEGDVWDAVGEVALKLNELIRSHNQLLQRVQGGKK